MTETVTAIYENGILRPTRPLNLRERQRVRIQVWPEETAPDERQEILDILVKAGLVRPHPQAIPPDPVSPEARQALADRLGRMPGKPLSEIIIEDRGER